MGSKKGSTAMKTVKTGLTQRNPGIKYRPYEFVLVVNTAVGDLLGRAAGLVEDEPAQRGAAARGAVAPAGGESCRDCGGGR